MFPKRVNILPNVGHNRINRSFQGGKQMADFMFVKDAATLWNISERQVIGLCSRGKIPGAVKQGRSWMIPTTAEKPADQRVKSGA